MARSSLRDPLDKFRWAVQIAGFTKLGFETTTAPGYKLTTNKYAEGGSHLNPRSIIDGAEFKPVVLSVGVTTDTSFAKWASGPFYILQNNAALN
jgi:phage tail-like protein